VSQVPPSDGPNKAIWYVGDLDDTTHYDWVQNQEYDSLQSPFMQKQYGDFLPLNAVACTATVGGNGRYISAANWASGVMRHESGQANSHWADYANFLSKDANNLKFRMEGIVGAPQLSASRFLDQLNTAYEPLVRRLASFHQSYPEPCNAVCTPDCVFVNGNLNVPPYKP
jgi:hypothetical protein